MPNILEDLQCYVDSLIDSYQVPAASIAVWHNNKIQKAAAGILNIATGVEATTDSLFKIGSVTKVFTTSLIMQLVDQGKIKLDKPVKYYLRDFHIADAEATQAVTVRQLLNHTSGIAGDFFPSDIHSEGNAIARYVDRINLIPLVHTPGAQFSYSNAALAVAGRLVEVLTGLPWHQVIKERIFTPLGMKHAIADPKEALRYRVAMGHFRDPDNLNQWRVSSKCYSTLGLAPSGSILSMSAADLIIFARAHLNQGKASSGERWLSPESIQLMQTATVELPANSEQIDRYWCLGWGRWTDTRSGRSIIYHSGLVNSQTAMLQLVPDMNLALAVLLNSAKPGVIDTVVSDILKHLTKIDIKEPSPTPIQLSAEELKRYVGQFDNLGARYDLSLVEDIGKDGLNGLSVSCFDKWDKTSTESLWLPIGDQLFATFNGEGIRGRNAVFVTGTDDRSVDQLFMGLRVSNRQGTNTQ